MTDLWSIQAQRTRAAAEPLALRMRPQNLQEYLGQEHLLGEGKLLRKLLIVDRLASAIFWGPPGTGKTALTEVIARHTGRDVHRANAALIGVKEIRHILEQAIDRLEANERRTILILDEIHRFSRNQQDVLLSDVERGVITLIGITTENPYFAVRSSLVSRSTVFRFEPLEEHHIAALIHRAIGDERGFGGCDIRIEDEAVSHWARVCEGDARRALNALEVAVLSQTPNTDDGNAHLTAHEPRKATRGRIVIDLTCAEQSIQAKALVHDGTGDEHYDLASALIKSMRGSDPDAAVYWLARMLEAGEDPRFIARRIAILASEDIGNADPQAIQVAAAAWQLTERVGMPECRFALAQAVIYMATAVKSDASAKALANASADVRQRRTVPVPKHLRDASYRGAEELGHGQKYVNPHHSADGYVPQEYLGVDRVYYTPTARGFEAQILRQLQARQARIPKGDEHSASQHTHHD